MTMRIALLLLGLSACCPSVTTNPVVSEDAKEPQAKSGKRGSSCSHRSECSVPLDCVGSICDCSCGLDRDCGDGYFCDCVCYEKPGCYSDVDCYPGQACKRETGDCYTKVPCESDSDCPEGKECVEKIKGCVGPEDDLLNQP